MKAFLPAVLFAIAFSSGQAAVQPAHAVSLVGAQIQGEWDFVLTFAPNPFTVGTGVDSVISVTLPPPAFSDDVMNVDFTPNQLILTYTDEGGLSIGAFGPKFTLLSGGPFDAVSSVVSSVAGMNAGRVSNTGLVLTLDFGGLSFSTNDQIVITFGPEANVPLPALFHSSPLASA